MNENIIYCDTTEQYISGISGNDIQIGEYEIPFSENNIYIPKNLVGQAEQTVINAITRQYKENEDAIYLGDLETVVKALAVEEGYWDASDTSNPHLSTTVVAARGILRKGMTIPYDDSKYDLYVNGHLQDSDYKDDYSGEFITFIMFVKNATLNINGLSYTEGLYKFRPIEFYAYKDNSQYLLTISNPWFENTQYFTAENWNGGGELHECRVYKQNINPQLTTYTSSKLPEVEEIIYSGNDVFPNFFQNLFEVKLIDLSKVKNFQYSYNIQSPIIGVNPENSIDLYLEDVLTINAGYYNGGVSLFRGFNTLHIGADCEKILRNNNGTWQQSTNYLTENCNSLILDCIDVNINLAGIDKDEHLSYIELGQDWNSSIDLSTCTGITDLNIWKNKVLGRLKVLSSGTKTLTIPLDIWIALGASYISQIQTTTKWTISSR